MPNIEDLKIEFRAIPYGSSHVLEYRISPNQDLTYEKEVNIFSFKFKKTKKYKTNWHQPHIIINYPGAYLYSKESGVPYLPIFIHTKEELELYKIKYKTCGEFFDYIDNYESNEESKWLKERNKYLENHKIWE